MRDKILKAFQKHKKLGVSALEKQFNVSRQALHRHLQILLREGKIVKQGTSRKTTFYLLNSPAILKSFQGKKETFQKRFLAKDLDEDTAYREIENRSGIPNKLSNNANRLFRYGFTEMLNNAIDHSKTHFIDVSVEIDPQSISFSITDRGVGIFENIRSKKKLASEMEALQDLLKGKQTTLPEYHSGEGIFFTSKAADYFAIASHRKKLIVDNRIGDIFVEDIRSKKGTLIFFKLNSRSTKKLDLIFKEYTGEEFQFTKSMVTVKLFQEGGEYVSRSQAKRLLHAMDRFKEIRLDFQGVKTVGQGFADEIFRVFSSRHPKIKIIPVHCHENVQFMINRAKKE